MFMLCVVCCCVCKRQLVLLSVRHYIGSYLKYDISYHGIVLCVGISTVEQDTYAILVKYLARENGGREKKLQISCVCCVL